MSDSMLIMFLFLFRCESDKLDASTRISSSSISPRKVQSTSKQQDTSSGSSPRVTPPKKKRFFGPTATTTTTKHRESDFSDSSEDLPTPPYTTVNR